jgi:hypothetical protein
MTHSPVPPPGTSPSARQTPFQASADSQLPTLLLRSPSLNGSVSIPSDDNGAHGKSDNDGSSSELEEGEISEPTLQLSLPRPPPLPPQLPVSSPPLPSRFRKSSRRVRSEQTDPSSPLDHEQPLSVMEYQRLVYTAPPLPLVPFPFPAALPQIPLRYLLFLFFGGFASFFALISYYILIRSLLAIICSSRDYQLRFRGNLRTLRTVLGFTRHGLTAGMSTDRADVEAEKSLEDLLTMGMTYDDLVAEGMHPGFLDQLFARFRSRSPSRTPRSASVIPPQPPTPDPFLAPKHPIPIKPNGHRPDLSAQVETFLDNLEPTISTSNGGDETKKRRFSSEQAAQPAKRRAFGRAFGVAVGPNELVIDVSDDESDDEQHQLPRMPPPKLSMFPHHLRTATPPTIPTPRRGIAASNRPGMTKEVSSSPSASDVQDLRDKDIAIAAAIAAMKRKIEAKLKTRTESSDASFAQELAASIMDKNDATPNQSPTVQSPEVPRETFATTEDRPESNLSMPFPDNIPSPATPEPQSIPSPIFDSATKPLTLRITQPNRNSSTSPSPRNEDLKMNELGTESDEEDRLVIQLEEQRLAEEQARERRRKLEERLAAARRQNSRSPIHTREGRVTEIIQSSTSSLCVKSVIDIVRPSP